MNIVRKCEKCGTFERMRLLRPVVSSGIITDALASATHQSVTRVHVRCRKCRTEYVWVRETDKNMRQSDDLKKL